MGSNWAGFDVAHAYAIYAMHPRRAVETAIRVAVIAALVGWCFVIARPFLMPIIWGAIIAITVSRGYRTIRERFRRPAHTGCCSDHFSPAHRAGCPFCSARQFTRNRRRSSRGLISKRRVLHSAAGRQRRSLAAGGRTDREILDDRISGFGAGVPPGQPPRSST